MAKSKGIRISKKYGLNCSIDHCFICGKESGIAMFGTSYKDENGKTAEAPKNVCTGNLCNDCQKIIDEGGVFFIEVYNRKNDNDNPDRTGRYCAIKKEAAEKIFNNFNPNINFVEKDLYEKLFINNYGKDKSTKR